jgi:hypothetical protein
MGFVEYHDVVMWKDGALRGNVESVKVCIDDDNIGICGSAASGFCEALVAARTASSAGAFIAADGYLTGGVFG